jgi:ParB family chromosome partitioning protein
MDPIEEAEAFRRYVIDFGWGGVSELARKIGKSEEYVSHHIQLLKLPNDIKQRVASNSLKVSQAIEIAQFPNDKQPRILSQVVNNNLTVRQIRELKNVLREEKEGDFDNMHIDSSHSHLKSFIITKKTSLTLKIALTRLDNLINEVHTTVEPEDRAEIINFLMSVRLRVHSLIDESIRFKSSLRSAAN